MACARLDLASPFLAPAAPHLLARDEPLPRLAAFLAGAAEAFGEQAAVSASGELERFADGLRQGALAAAMVPADREAMPDGGATLIAQAGGRSSPVWTRAGGAAAALAGGLLSRGSSPRRRRRWLSAGGTASAGLYRSLDWPCGTQLSYARPGARLTWPAPATTIAATW